MKGLLTKIAGIFQAKQAGIRTAHTASEIAELFASINGYGDSSSGERVSLESAQRVSAVFACIGVLAESVAQLPLKVYKQLPDGGKEVAAEHHLLPLISRQPNPWMTAFEWREMAQAWLCAEGNHYAFLNRVGGKVREILPLPSSSVSVERNQDWSLKYRVNFGEGRGQQDVPAANMLHIRYRTLNGYKGVSIIGHARESIGLALATEKHGARLFRNNARPGGVLETDKSMSEAAVKRFKDNWQDAFTGANAHKTAVLEEGMKFNPMTMTSEDAQYLETRRFQVAEIARMYRVPLHMIGETERSTSWGSGIESMTIGFTRFTLLPWLIRWEQALMRDLLSEEEKQDHTIRHVVGGMERGDMKSRFAAYQVGIQNGWMSPNEVRELEEMNHREGGDIYLTPTNMRIGNGNETDPGDESGNGQLAAKP
jgi:HK97 family phage portal protein